MEFLEFMEVMFDLQKKFPGMTWEVESEARGEVAVRLPVGAENAALLKQAQAMFAPVES